MDKEELKQYLNTNEEYRKYLFIRGFLLTNDKKIDESAFPFYNQWKHISVSGFEFYTHPKTGFHYITKNEITAFIFGHCYNPFTMEIEEEKQLENILDAYGTTEFYDKLSEITGVFVFGIIDKNRVVSFVDPSGMQSACEGVVDGNFYLSSHFQLIGDILNLEMDKFVKELVNYKWYGRVMGAYLPADLTAFSNIKRIVPNIEYTYDCTTITHKRFYPLKEIQECKTEEEYNATIKSGADILKNNMELISKKWKAPWISLTGGIDSNTTFASANGIYDRFQTFSYCSAEKETIDCSAAEHIAKHFCIPWTKYVIPEDENEIKDADVKIAIIKHNNGHIGKEKSNELLKRLYLEQNIGCDVEVKSWVSETIRAYWYKHYGRKRMPRLSPKLFRNLYKIFISNRKLAHKVDKVFKNYIDDFEYEKIPAIYPQADMHYNEVTWGSWGGLNISEMKFYSDITFIYNNRVFLDTMFKIPLKDRISDKHHLEMKKYLNKELYDMNIRVVNMKETKFRAFALNIIFTTNMILPF